MFSSEQETVAPEFSDAFVKVVAESINVHALVEDACHELSEDVNCRVKHIIEIAYKFALRAKRLKLTASDVDRALKLCNIEPLYGFSAPDEIPFRFASGGGRDVFFAAENQLDIQQVINQSVPKAPQAPRLKAHWLGIEGVQPAIPENPAPSLIGNNFKDSKANRSRIGPKLRKMEVIQVRPLAPHELSLEQQIYFKEITEACIGSDEVKRGQSLQSLATDTGLTPLLPRIALFICEGVKCSALQHNMALLIYLMRMIKALTDNNAICLQKQLHLLCPAMLTCVVSKQLCVHPNVDNHWALREFSARQLAALTKCYTKSMFNVDSRIMHILCNALVDTSCLNSVYGALYAINEMGPQAVKSLVVPRCISIGERLRPLLERAIPQNDRKAADQCHKILTKGVVSFVHHDKPRDLQELNDFRTQFGLVGQLVFQECANAQTVSRSKVDLSRPSTPLSTGGSSRHTDSPVAKVASRFALPPQKNLPQNEFRPKEEIID